MDNKEWLNEHETLKKVNSGNPFTVPAGYFDELQQRITSSVFLEGLTPQAGFSIPEGYFNELENNIQSRINIEAALQHSKGDFTVPDNYFDDMQGQIAARIAIEETMNGKTEGFEVPDNYFDVLQAQITARVAIEEAVSSEAESFTVPAGYFENLQAQITARVAIEEAMSGKTEGFEVPQNYFDKLQDAIMAKTVAAEEEVIEEPTAIVRPLSPVRPQKSVLRKLVNSGVFKYATAACITIAVGGTWFLNRYESPVAKHKRSYLHKELSTVPDDAIIDYLQLHMDAADTRGVMDDADQINTNDANSEDLKNYLSTH